MPQYDDVALRVAIDLRDAYDATMALWRQAHAAAGRLVWKTVRGRDYLYRTYGNAGNGSSLGPRSPETEVLYEQFRSDKARIKEQLADTEPDLKRAAAMYVAAGLPVLDSWAAKLFQHLDRAELMGPAVFVVGTNAMPAYQLEAQQRTGQRLHATRDTDIAWTALVGEEARLWPSLREWDPSFVINSERPFQARGRAMRELDVLAAPSRIAAMSHEPFHPAELPEQEWLLMGTPLRHVVASFDRTPCAIVVPDPRYFALHKAWLARKPGRDPLKAPRDRRQAETVWAWLAHMARYSIDAGFLRTLPDELANIATTLIDSTVA